MTGVASGDALDECTQLHRHFYLATLDDLIVAARGLIDDVLQLFVVVSLIYKDARIFRRSLLDSSIFRYDTYFSGNVALKNAGV